MPDAVAKILFDSMDLSPAMAMLVLLAALALFVAMLHTATSLIVDEFRHRQSSRAARQLIAEEKAKKAAAATQQQQHTSAAAGARAAAAPGSASASEEPSGSTLMKRFCRFCDVQVEDEHMESHEAGKKHRKLRAAAQALANESTCWTWMPVPVTVAPVPHAEDTDAAEKVVQSPSAAAGSRGGKAKGQSTKWSKVPGPGARRR